MVEVGEADLLVHIVLTRREVQLDVVGEELLESRHDRFISGIVEATVLDDVDALVSPLGFDVARGLFRGGRLLLLRFRVIGGIGRVRRTEVGGRRPIRNRAGTDCRAQYAEERPASIRS
ncbi:hypothetical protein [Halegenticoccus soli]|uniref:hypothetical protein n=1 Tax=Halegenticoccus soli TaxID=1985678 RepID=UPI00117A37BC|nr:hypothetical protein [Halegenticoccus soli]